MKPLVYQSHLCPWAMSKKLMILMCQSLQCGLSLLDNAYLVDKTSLDFLYKIFAVSYWSLRQLISLNIKWTIYSISYTQCNLYWKNDNCKIEHFLIFHYSHINSICSTHSPFWRELFTVDQLTVFPVWFSSNILDHDLFHVYLILLLIIREFIPNFYELGGMQS